MTDAEMKVQTGTDQEIFLSEVIGRRVTGRKKIGKLSDLVIQETEPLPQVTHIVVSRPFGHHQLLIPIDRVSAIGSQGVQVAVESPDAFEQDPAAGAVLLKDYVLDKKVIDVDDKEVEMVYDVRLVRRNGVVYVTDVDTSRFGLLRRIGLKWLATYIYAHGEGMDEEMISWRFIQPLPSTITGFRGNVKLKVLKETLEKIHPMDLADILEELDPDQRVMIFSELETETASDALEEIEPNVQRELVSSLSRDRVVQLIDEMTPGQAADLLSVLPHTEANELLELLDTVNARKIRAILEKQEETILNYATMNCLMVPPDKTAEQVRVEYQTAARGMDVVMYLYIVDSDQHLIGVLDIKELLVAGDEALMREIMIPEVIALTPESTLKEAYTLFERYNLRALPMVDGEDRLLGVIPFRDIMNLKHNFLE
ncbi:magnesium transporter MgtE N-terminal domain-containing protein [Methanosphaerula palustris]|uniref:MgtE intracellular region n=1 Tax=Methanosphaerula palustris (strain ATCC BAA-1556 / DSM 19958 / E1-9c) TaxID=521011 RepID=B8GID5_METPE|nr:CBS domain-containing protein [Methanosphaerula palustris]ACL15486.1 MgtE intracellular region [Methanosphaerula palustris E1-9c]